MNTKEENPMEPKPVQVIEYANPDTRALNRDEPAALVLGIFAAILAAISLVLLLIGRIPFMPDFAPLANLFGLIAGGVGWGLSRHSRPNASHRLCAWANTVNWISFFGGFIYLFNR
jgi:hypothetical protein